MADQRAVTSEIDEGQMTLIDHLTELRNRLGIALVAFIVIFLVLLCILILAQVSSDHLLH